MFVLCLLIVISSSFFTSITATSMPASSAFWALMWLAGAVVVSRTSSSSCFNHMAMSVPLKYITST